MQTGADVGMPPRRSSRHLRPRTLICETMFPGSSSYSSGTFTPRNDLGPRLAHEASERVVRGNGVRLSWRHGTKRVSSGVSTQEPACCLETRAVVQAASCDFFGLAATPVVGWQLANFIPDDCEAKSHIVAFVTAQSSASAYEPSRIW